MNGVDMPVLIFCSSYCVNDGDIQCKFFWGSSYCVNYMD